LISNIDGIASVDQKYQPSPKMLLNINISRDWDEIWRNIFGF